MSSHNMTSKLFKYVTKDVILDGCDWLVSRILTEDIKKCGMPIKIFFQFDCIYLLNLLTLRKKEAGNHNYCSLEIINADFLMTLTIKVFNNYLNLKL